MAVAIPKFLQMNMVCLLFKPLHGWSKSPHDAIEPSALRAAKALWTIKLDASGKQGRYVRIQLLDKNYLSLAEVQVIGVDL
jgi:hypothetical protein